MVKFQIEGKEVRYSDDIWPHGIQIYPYPKGTVKQLLASRSQRMQSVGLLIADANHGKNLEDYEKCETEEDIIEMIRNDCKLKGLKEVA